ncbi:ferredoxin, 2Fe-2S [Collimonas sp. OK607]|uniref:2Fe-2S iron-sulfur cluster-binding protein n=1 Tax=Collimonas sp. OK607 TaxID=1798194 RepID=UPI0008E1614F|nr:2Fe-2S iron-sulfur cluster-binding protein [Collimonas sp. OK607]SFB38742.1 ferredoxin, 2Fe-2S [Collimonas sp. OK607]
MSKVIYISHAGSRHELDVADGVSLMQAAVSNGVYEIVGDCGGSASCATCHVYVDDLFLARLPAATLREQEMLQCTAAELQAGSRLSCQIAMTEALDGLTVRMPDQQW